MSRPGTPAQGTGRKTAARPIASWLAATRLADAVPAPYRASVMRLFARFACLAFAAAILGGGGVAASAQEQARTIKATVSGKEIAIPAPHGYCDIEPDQRRDKLLLDGIDAIGEGQRTLRRLAPCSELKAWRNDKSPDLPELVQILAPPVTMAGNQKAGRAGWLEAVTGNRPPLGVAALKKVVQRGFPDGARKSAPLGLVEKDGRAAHVADAVLASFDGESHELLSMRAWTMTLNTGVPLLVQSLRAFDTDPQTVDVAIVEQRDHVDRLLSANGEPSSRFSPSRPPPVAQPRLDRDLPKARPRPTVRSNDDFFGRHGGLIALGMMGTGLALILASRVGGRFVRRPI